MSQIVQGKTWVNGEVITHTALNASQANLVTTVNDLAGQYKTLLTTTAGILAGEPAATKILSPTDSDTYLSNAGEGIYESGDNIIAGLTFRAFVPMIYFDDADATATSLIQKLRLRAQVNTNNASPTITFTFGLYPVTFAGGTEVFTVTLGTVVSGSTVAIASPAATSTVSANSGDFTIPSDGQYALGCVTSAMMPDTSAALLTAQLQTRSV